ncbi:MAG: efflux RND transporter periplasmic adaptor subunit [Sphingomicrobium sp.]
MNHESRFESSDTLVVVDRPSRRRWIILAAVLIGVAAILLMTGVIGGKKDDTAAAGPAAAGGKKGGVATAVSVTVPGRSEVARTITASGALAARRDQPVGVAGEGGLVRSVNVDAGSWVRQGQVLASIDRSVQSQTAAQLSAQVSAARADAALAQNEYERSLALVERGFVSKADLDRKMAARDAARARVNVAQAQLGAARAQIGRLDIRAPTSGLILARNVEVGQVVSAGSGGLFRIASGGEMEMRAQLSQQDLAAVRVGVPASITAIGSDSVVQGRVWQVSPVINPQSRLGEVRIAVPYSAGIRPGGFAEAKITSGTTTAPMLPQSAVLADSKGNYVYIVNAKNEIERRNVEIGEVSDDGVTVRSGIAGNEQVVVSAGPFLNPGQKVAPRKIAISAALTR